MNSTEIPYSWSQSNNYSTTPGLTTHGATTPLMQRKIHPGLIAGIVCGAVSVLITLMLLTIWGCKKYLRDIRLTSIGIKRKNFYRHHTRSIREVCDNAEAIQSDREGRVGNSQIYVQQQPRLRGQLVTEEPPSVVLDDAEDIPYLFKGGFSGKTFTCKEGSKDAAYSISYEVRESDRV